MFNRIDDEQFYRNPDTERYELNIMCFGYEYMYICYTLYYTDNEIFLEKPADMSKFEVDIYKVNDLYKNDFLTAINLKKNNK